VKRPTGGKKESFIFIFGCLLRALSCFITGRLIDLKGENNNQNMAALKKRKGDAASNGGEPQV